MSAILLAALATAPGASLLAQTAPPRLTARVVWQTADNDDLALSRISGIAVDARNRVFAAMPNESMVYAFGADGKLLTKFARSGSGPGEFQRNCCAAFDARGRLWVQDNGNARYVVFTIAENGAGISAKPAFVVKIPHGDPNYGVRLQFDEHGNVFSIGHTASQSDHAITEITRFRTDTLGNVVNKIIEPQQTENVAQPFLHQVKDGANTNTVYFWQPYGASALRADGPNGSFALAGSGAYVVRWFDPAGKLLRTLTKSIEGPLVTAAERKSSDSTLAADALRKHTTLAALPFRTPPRKSPLAAIYFDADGRLWVQRSTALGAAREADVYSPAGTQLFTAVWPANISLSGSSFIRGRDIWAVLYDTDEVPHIVRLELPAPK